LDFFKITKKNIIMGIIVLLSFFTVSFTSARYGANIASQNDVQAQVKAYLNAGKQGITDYAIDTLIAPYTKEINGKIEILSSKIDTLSGKVDIIQGGVSQLSSDSVNEAIVELNKYYNTLLAHKNQSWTLDYQDKIKIFFNKVQKADKVTPDLLYKYGILNKYFADSFNTGAK